MCDSYLKSTWHSVLSVFSLTGVVDALQQWMRINFCAKTHSRSKTPLVTIHKDEFQTRSGKRDFSSCSSHVRLCRLLSYPLLNQILTLQCAWAEWQSSVTLSRWNIDNWISDFCQAEKIAAWKFHRWWWIFWSVHRNPECHSMIWCFRSCFKSWPCNHCPENQSACKSLAFYSL